MEEGALLVEKLCGRRPGPLVCSGEEAHIPAWLLGTFGPPVLRASLPPPPLGVPPSMTLRTQLAGRPHRPHSFFPSPRPGLRPSLSSSMDSFPFVFFPKEPFPTGPADILPLQNE